MLDRDKIAIDSPKAILNLEGNYEKWGATIFPPANDSKIDLTKRRRSKLLDAVDADGNEVKGYVVIIPGDGERAFNSDTLDVLAGLQKIFYERGMPDTPIETSLNDILSACMYKDNGQNVKLVKRELASLSRTTVSWESSFKSPENKTTTIKDHRLLDEFGYVENSELVSTRKRKFDRHRVSFRLAEHIRVNLRERIIIPVNVAARRKIKSPLGRTIYSRTDNILTFTNRPLEQNASTLIEEYQLLEDKYKFPSRRKQLCENMAKYIDGSESSKEGYIIRAKAAATSSADDYKIKFRLEKKSVKPVGKLRRLPTENGESLQAHLACEIAAVVGEKDKNEKLYMEYTRVYSEAMIFRAIGEFKEARLSGMKIKSTGAVFSAILHRIAHQTNVSWIRDCDDTCKFRPENLLF